MQRKEICRSLSKYLLLFSLALVVPLAKAFYEKNTSVFSSFLYTLLITYGISFLFYLFSKRAKGILLRRESIVTVVLAWITSVCLAALPFYLSKTLEHPIDALFESVSALTTTGSSVFCPKAYLDGQEVPLIRGNVSYFGTITPLKDPVSGAILQEGVGAVSQSILLWRLLLQWIGGVGIIVLFLSVLPALSMGGRFLFEAETTGPHKEGLTPRIKETGSLLWKIYLFLSILAILVLKLTNSSLSLFESFSLALSAISTGGFTTTADTAVLWNHKATRVILTFLMVLGSINFTLYFYCLKGKIYKVFDKEFQLYLFSLVFFGSFLSWILWSCDLFAFKEAVSNGFFQAISAQTSTGFVINNYDLWPFSAQMLLLFLTYIGGMSGSTSGGMKLFRVLILFKAVITKIKTLYRPETITSIKISHKEISKETVNLCLVYVCVLIVCVTLSSFIYVVDGLDPYSAFGLSSSMINNSGLSFGQIGPTSSCAFLPLSSKLLSILLMLLGRLEFFVILVLFVPSFWRNR